MQNPSSHGLFKTTLYYINSAVKRRSLDRGSKLTAPRKHFRLHAAPNQQEDSSAPTQLEDASAEDDTSPSLLTPIISPALPWTPLLALLAVHVSNQWSRALIYYVNKFDAVEGADAAFRCVQANCHAYCHIVNVIRRTGI
eukprot:8492640-Pyramimonas_sp.AAC.1